MENSTKSADNEECSDEQFEQHIAKLRLSHNELTRTLARFTELYDAAPIGYLSLDDRFTVTESNLTFAEMLGVLRSDILDSAFPSLVDDTDRKLFFSNHQKCLQEQIHLSYDLHLKKSFDQLLAVRVDYLPPFPSEQNLACRLAVRDISHFKELKSKLQNETRLRQNILDALPCIAYLLRHDTYEIVATNKAAALEGLVPGSKCYRSWIEQDSACPWCRGSAVNYDGKAHHLQYWNNDTYWDNHWIPVEDDFYLHCVFDITKTEKTKAALHISNDELERLVERRTAELKQYHRRLLESEKLAAVGRVAIAIAQELNDPLQAITNVLGGIHRRGSFEQEDQPLVNLAYDELKKLNNLVRDLREYYQPTHGKTDLFDVRAELEEIIELNRPRLADKGIGITTEFTENLPLIHAVADQLRTVFQNLLENAIEYRSQGDMIRIATSVDKNNLVLHFKADCSGLDQSALSRISSQLLDPLNQAKTKGSARSLPLAKSYAIIAMHGGTIETTSDQEESGFQVILPIHYSTLRIGPATL